MLPAFAELESTTMHYSPSVKRINAFFFNVRPKFFSKN
tara:strand:- start:244 stop:357 length:114 start_codon:yes stop_codon:yes gene_type:complete